MLEELSRAVKPQKGIGSHIEVRCELLRRGHTLQSFARKHGTSVELVRQVISGRCPGRRGRAASIRRDIKNALAESSQS